MRESKESYREKLLDPRWQKKRLQILERDNWKCRDCGTASRTLHVHHSYYRDDAEGPWDYEDHTLLTLCAECHEAEQQMAAQWRKEMPGYFAKVGFTRASEMVDLVSSFEDYRQTFSEEEKNLIIKTIGLVMISRGLMNDDGDLWASFRSLLDAYSEYPNKKVGGQ